MTQPLSLAGASLTLRSADTITAAGTGSLSAATITFDDVGATARTWTINGTSVTRSPGAAAPYSGVTTLYRGRRCRQCQTNVVDTSG